MGILSVLKKLSRRRRLENAEFGSLQCHRGRTGKRIYRLPLEGQSLRKA